MLHEQDLYILLKIAVLQNQRWTFSSLSESLEISTSQIHLGLRRAEESRLYYSSERRVVRQALGEFITHGVKYSFPVIPGKLERGMLTSFAAFPIKERLIIEPGSHLPVWPDSEGEVVGYSIKPLHSGAPKAAKRDPDFYELLALVDVLREGKVRERNLAKNFINELFHFRS